jgi:hypothetical protein
MLLELGEVRGYRLGQNRASSLAPRVLRAALMLVRLAEQTAAPRGLGLAALVVGHA